MARYRMDDGIVVDTDAAAAHWSEQRNWDGNNYVSVNTGSQWVRESLHQSRKHRYYIETTSQYQGHGPSARWLTRAEAAAWLLLNDCDIPRDLADCVDQISE